MRQGIIVLLVSAPITAVLASSITINSNDLIEFGQGSAEVVVCDDQIALEPEVTFDGEGFQLSSVLASQIDDTACANKNLVLSVYSTAGTLLVKETLEVTASAINFDLSSVRPAIGTEQVGAITAEILDATASPTATPTPTPTFVTTNLLMRLDASDSSSYSGTGTTWFDISGNSRNAGIFNSPTFTSADGGAFTFTGSSNYMSLGNISALKPTSELTISQWLNATDWAYNSGSDYRASISSTQGGGYAIFVRAGLLSGYLYVNGNYRAPSVSGNELSGWHHVALTFDGRYTKLYVDGIEEAVVDAGGTYSIGYNANNSIIIGAEASGTEVPESGRRWEGKIGSTEIYSRALSDSEVLENYNATKNRFGK